MSASLGAGSARQAALLIDADNFSEPQAIDAAWTEFNAYAGRVSVCRAYGHWHRLQSLGSVWRYLGTRTFPNLQLEKNTTDAALIADAVALHFQQGVRLFAIASGDADFAPLAARLREWGCEVWCFSMEGIVFRDAETYYDRVRCFPSQVPPHAPLAPMPLLRPAMPPAAGSHADAARPSYRSAAAPPQTPPASEAGLPDEVARILSVIPALRERAQHLCHVVPVLQQHGFFDKRVTKSTAFLAQHADYFELSPAYKPTQIRFRPPPAQALHEPPAAPGQTLLPPDAGAEVYVAADDAGAGPASAAPAASAEDGLAVQRILGFFSTWQPETAASVRSLSMMETLLQESDIPVGGKPLAELFALYPDCFEMLPATGPAIKVRLLKKPQALESTCL